MYFSYVLYIRAFKATDLTGDCQIINTYKTLECICLIQWLSAVCHLQECVMRGKKTSTFFNCHSLMCHLPWFICCNWYQREWSMTVSKAPGIQTVSQVSALALGCRVGLHGSLQELGHIRIICSQHPDSKSICFDVILRRTLFIYLFLVAFEKHHADKGVRVTWLS